MKYLNTPVKVSAIFPEDGKFYPKNFIYKDIYTVTKIKSTWINNNWQHGQEYHFEVQAVGRRNTSDERICHLCFMSGKNIWVLVKF